MANGDAAAAAGLASWPDSQDLREGVDNDNIRGDEIAAEIAARATAVNAEAVARAAADALKLDAAKVIISDSTPANIAGAGYSGRIWIKRA